MAKSFLLFTWAPGFEIIAGFKTREEAEAAIQSPFDHMPSNYRFGDYLGIIEAEMIETPVVLSAVTNENPFLALDLRPSEIEILAKEIAENSADTNDHQKIAWLKEAYEANMGVPMAVPYP